MSRRAVARRKDKHAVAKGRSFESMFVVVMGVGREDLIESDGLHPIAAGDDASVGQPDCDLNHPGGNRLRGKGRDGKTVRPRVDAAIHRRIGRAGIRSRRIDGAPVDQHVGSRPVARYRRIRGAPTISPSPIQGARVVAAASAEDEQAHGETQKEERPLRESPRAPRIFRIHLP